MEKGMEEPYIEGVATHGGPDHAPTSVRTSVKRWVGVRAGQLLSREINVIGVPTSSLRAEGNIVGSAMRELPADPARSENLCMRGISMRENREVGPAPGRWTPGLCGRG